MRLPCFAALALIAGCASAPRATSTRPVVVTTSGPIVGTIVDDTRVFLGVPYAASPSGSLRWRPPAPVAPWRAPRDATKPGPACPQLAANGVTRAFDEDCLSLNVWAPARPSPARPVMVWIHGGAFYQGSGNDDLYDGKRLAARADVIVVTINYRLGALGFLSHAAVARELGRAAAPSVGLLDQRAALAWVRDNIAAFGGDPARVTLFGQSAGAWSTCAHLAMPGSRGLFARAILQSGGCEKALYASAAEAEAQADALAAKVGCAGSSSGADVLACLRAKPAAELLAALPMKRGLVLLPGIWWGPVVDGVELPREPLEQIRAGGFANVPLLLGAARDEGALHVIGFPTVTADEAASFPRDVWGDDAARAIVAAYPRETPKATLSAIIGDGVFVCQARRIARAVAATDDTPVFLYEFAHPLDDPRVSALGATHSVDLFFVFGNTSLGYGVRDRERALSHAMMDAWGAFARTGDPSTPSLRWPRYTRRDDEHLTLDLPRIERGAHLKAGVCDFWDTLPPQPLRGL